VKAPPEWISNNCVLCSVSDQITVNAHHSIKTQHINSWKGTSSLSNKTYRKLELTACHTIRRCHWLGKTLHKIICFVSLSPSDLLTSPESINEQMHNNGPQQRFASGKWPVCWVKQTHCLALLVVIQLPVSVVYYVFAFCQINACAEKAFRTFPNSCASQCP